MSDDFREELIKKLDENRLYEGDLLNAILKNAYSGRDMCEVTSALLVRFPSVRAVLKAEYNEIISVDGVTESVALYLKALGRALENQVQRDVKITDTDEFIELVRFRFVQKDKEFLELFLLNKCGRIVKVNRYTSDRWNRVDVSAKKVVGELTTGGADVLYVVHNHVNSPTSPSVKDDEITSKIYSVCKLCNIAFGDHVIVNGVGEAFSYRKSGRLDKVINNRRTF